VAFCRYVCKCWNEIAAAFGQKDARGIRGVIRRAMRRDRRKMFPKMGYERTEDEPEWQFWHNTSMALQYDWYLTWWLSQQPSASPVPEKTI